MSENKCKIELTHNYLILCIAGQDNYYDTTKMIAQRDQPNRTICAAHAHAELSVELCLAAAKHSVQQLR